MSKHFIFLGALAVILALGIGVAVFLQYQASFNQTVPKAVPVIDDKYPDEPPDKLPAFLSENDKKLLSPLPADIASTLYKQQYQALVAAAKLGNKIEIKQCFGLPTVLKILKSKKTTITFTNTDNLKHTLYLAGKQYLLPAQGSVKIIASDNKVGIYGYRCDNYTTFTGLIFVAEK